MVRDALGERLSQFFGIRLLSHDEKFALTLTKTHTVLEQVAVGYLVNLACELACVEVYVLAAFLELVQFLKDNYRNINVVFFKIVNTFVVVQQDISVQHKIFLCSHSLITLNGFNNSY